MIVVLILGTVFLLFLVAYADYLESTVASRMMKQCDGKCGICGKKIGDDWQIPISREGVFHPSCYSKEWLKQHPPGSYNHFGL